MLELIDDELIELIELMEDEDIELIDESEDIVPVPVAPNV